MAFEETRNAIRKHYDALKARRDVVMKELAPLEKVRDDMRDKLAPLEGQLRAQNDKIKALKAKHGLFDLDQEIATLARALGAKSLQAESQ